MIQKFRNNKDVDRAIMFNDAVFAIALTLLVLELKLPDNANIDTPDGMIRALKEMSPHFNAFLLSSVLIGGNWISVNNLQRLIARIDLFFLADLVLYLIIISLIPFCCYLVGNHPGNPVSYLVFGGLCELLLFNACFFMRHCRLHNLYHENADLKEIRRLEKMLLLLSVLICGMIAVAWLNTTVAFVLFLIYSLIPFFVTQKLNITEEQEK